MAQGRTNVDVMLERVRLTRVRTDEGDATLLLNDSFVRLRPDTLITFHGPNVTSREVLRNAADRGHLREQLRRLEGR